MHPLKIIVCNKFYRPIGGPETIIFDTIRELKALGHESFPFAMAHPDNLESEYSDYFVQGVDYNTKQSKGVKRILSEARNIIYSTEAYNKITQLVDKVHPDIAHAHNIYHQLSPSILVALRKAGIPTVLTLHDYKLLCANMALLRKGQVCERCRGRKFYNAVINKCVKDSYANSLLCCIEETLHRVMGIYERNVDLVISPSQFLKQKLVEHGRLKENQIEVLPNYANTNIISPNFQAGEYGLFVGKLEKLKGVMTLLEACKIFPDFGIRFAGRGELLEEGTRFIESNKLDKIHFLGFQSGDDLIRLLKESRFVVAPSEWYENCPMVILEAFAAGKPVIATKMGGIPELINDGVDGMLYESGNADELANCIRKLAENPELAVEMGRNARKKVEQNYSMNVYMDRLLGLYNRVIEKKLHQVRK